MRRRSLPALFGERLAWMQMVIAYTPPRAPLRVSADDNISMRSAPLGYDSNGSGAMRER